MIEDNNKKQEFANAGKNTAHLASKSSDNNSYNKIPAALNSREQSKPNTQANNRLNNGLNGVGLTKPAGDLPFKKNNNSLGNQNNSLGSNNLRRKPTNNSLRPGKNLKNNNLGGNKNSKNLDSILPKALGSNRNKQGFLNNLRNRNVSNVNEEEPIDDNQDDYSNDYNNTENIRETTKKIIAMKKFLPIIGIVLAIFVVMFVIMFISNAIASSESFFSFQFQNTDEEAHVYGEDNPELLQMELNYNEKLDEVINKYRTDYYVTIDKYILHALIIYPYYISSSDLEKDNENGHIDYKAAIRKVDEVASLMVIKSAEDTYITDTEEGGLVYNNIVNSQFLKTYYKDFLTDFEEETRKNLVSEIYYFAEYVRELLITDNNRVFVSGEIQVNLQTCAVPYTFTEINGIRVYNNPLTNEGTNYQSYLVLTDYIKGVLMTEVGGYIKEEYKEGLKALSLAALSFILHDRESGFDLKNGTMYFPTGDCRQVACDPHNGCTYLYGKTKGDFGTAFVGLNRFGSTKGQHAPLSAEKNAFLNKILDEIFGYVLVKKGVSADTFSGSNDVVNLHYYSNTNISGCVAGYCIGQVEAMNDAKNGMSYTDILAKYYYNIDYDIINIKEGLYFESYESLDGGIELNEKFHFHQGDYRGSNSFCEGGKISSRGCSVSSTAIVVSLLTGQRHDPQEISNRLKSSGGCNGSRQTYSTKAAKLYNLKSYTVNKGNTSGINRMLEDLEAGNSAVVARLAPNSGRYSTTSGHYIAIVGVKNENGKIKVLVWDPGSRSSSRDNYWADFNSDILKYVRSDTSFAVLSR